MKIYGTTYISKTDPHTSPLEHKRLLPVMHELDRFIYSNFGYKTYPQTTPGNMWITGGFIRNLISPEDRSDHEVDVYFKNSAWYNKYTKDFLSRGGRVLNSRDLVNRCMAKDGTIVNFIKSYVASVSSTISLFDFTICMIAYDGKRMFFSERTLADIDNKILCPSCSINNDRIFSRIQKYAELGYTLPEEYSKAIAKDLRIKPSDGRYTPGKHGIYEETASLFDLGRGGIVVVDSSTLRMFPNGRNRDFNQRRKYVNERIVAARNSGITKPSLQGTVSSSCVEDESIANAWEHSQKRLARYQEEVQRMLDQQNKERAEKIMELSRKSAERSRQQPVQKDIHKDGVYTKKLSTTFEELMSISMVDSPAFVSMYRGTPANEPEVAGDR